MAVYNGNDGNNILVGSADDDALSGLDGNDLLIGLAGSDALYGGDGNDILDAVAGADNPYRAYPYTSHEVNTLRGGLGDDVFIAWDTDVLQDSGGLSRLVIAANGSYTMPEGFDNLRIASIDQQDEHFTIIANSSSNVILPRSYHNTILAGAGDDRVYGGSSRDTINGGDGDDWLHGGGFYDSLTGGAGADHFVFDVRVNGYDADIVADFVTGVDKMHLDNRVMTALGVPGNFGAADGRFVSGAGLTGGQDASDRVVYDTTTGSLYYDPDGSGAASGLLFAILDGAPALAASDVVVEAGTLPGAVIYGTNREFEDIAATPYDDTIRGLAGNDGITGMMGDDFIDGGRGNDFIHGAQGDDTLVGGAGNDIFSLQTYPGEGSSGDDVIDGGRGLDTVSLDAKYLHYASSGIVLDLAAGILSGGSPGASATLASIERVIGTRFADSMRGSAGDEVFAGGRGDDTLVGAGGSDTLTGGAGRDHIAGGIGEDSYVFHEYGSAHADILVDFGTNHDALRFDASAFAGLGAAGRFAAGDGRFYAAAGATAGHDVDDRLVYDTSSGRLYFDPDGVGGADAQLVATLNGAPALLATDIWAS